MTSKNFQMDMKFEKKMRKIFRTSQFGAELENYENRINVIHVLIQKNLRIRSHNYFRSFHQKCKIVISVLGW